MIGSIIKIHSNFYYARVNDETLGQRVLECKIREKLKKEKAEVFVGDRVMLGEIDLESNQAAIIKILKRKNYIPRPSIANIDQIIIVAALDQPPVDLLQLNRYLAQAKLYDIPAVICINKSDLEDRNHTREEIISIYEPLGYQIIFTSALKEIGIDDFKKVLDSKVSVLSGTSGVGKSSLLNNIHPGLRLKTKEISAKTLRGTHATRHVEMLNIPLEGNVIAQVADTPGFSYLRFDNILPESVGNLFDEISSLAKDCYFSDCLHIEEDGCNVLVNLDKIVNSRYESYKTFVNEALEYKEKLTYRGHKKEERVKTIHSRDKEQIRIVKLGTQSREKSRRTRKQKLNFISSLDDAYYNNEEENLDNE